MTFGEILDVLSHCSFSKDGSHAPTIIHLGGRNSEERACGGPSTESWIKIVDALRRFAFDPDAQSVGTLSTCAHCGDRIFKSARGAWLTDPQLAE